MWQARVRAPESAGVGSHIVRSLKTRDRGEALRRLPVVVGQIKAQLQAARRTPDGVPKASPKDPTADDLKSALWWREHITKAGGDPERAANLQRRADEAAQAAQAEADKASKPAWSY